MNCIIVFKSMTYAQSARELLAKGGVACALTKPPISLGKGSCSHGIKIKSMDIFKARDLLSRMALAVKGVYSLSAAGKWQEVQW